MNMHVTPEVPALQHVIPSERWSSPWHDLPVGSFSESGTNTNTTLLTIHNPKEGSPR